MKIPTFPALLALGAAFGSVVSALNPIEVRGNQFVDAKTGNRFMVVGVDYQPGGQAGYKPKEGKDPLSDAEVCLRDAIMLQKLGVNAIRVYNLDPTINHDECASIFNYAGIYMQLDVNSPLSQESLNREEPWTTYHAGYLKRTFGIIEAFKDYPNTMAFFASNEVIDTIETAKNNPKYIRAVIRDLRNYIKAHADRQIPVGYSAADVRDVLEDTWQYLRCSIEGEKDDMSISDFFALNSYSWCGDSDFKKSKYNELVEMFKETNVPIFFSEYGCNEVQPRIFTEVQSIYGEEMDLLSGGLVYEYTVEEAGYGLVEVSDNGNVRVLVDYENLQEQYNKIDKARLQSMKPSSDSPKAPVCSKSLISHKGFSADWDLPEADKETESMIKSRISKPQTGKIVDVTKTETKYTITGEDGKKIDGLKLKKVSEGKSNLPSGNVISNGGSGDSDDDEGAASSLTVSFYSAIAVFDDKEYNSKPVSDRPSQGEQESIRETSTASSAVGTGTSLVYLPSGSRESTFPGSVGTVYKTGSYNSVSLQRTSSVATSPSRTSPSPGNTADSGCDSDADCQMGEDAFEGGSFTARVQYMFAPVAALAAILL